MRSRLFLLLGRRVVSIERIGNGGNSRLYHVVCDDSSEYAAKAYSGATRDGLDRMEVELSSLRFLRKNGALNISEPVTVDKVNSMAIFSFIHGEPVDGANVTFSDIDQAVDFLTVLKSLCQRDGSRSLPDASEARFFIDSVADNLERRISRLAGISENNGVHRQMHAFVVDELNPALDKILSWTRLKSVERGISMMAELPHNERTLSPSDFGFHNALRRDDGKLYFLDFEYFGWDDPAKTAVDFLLHPAMSLNDNLKLRFIERITSLFNEESFAKRVEIVYPLFGLKWCAILLNEFLPENPGRPGQEMDEPLCADEILTRQLAKSRDMLRRVMSGYRSFRAAV